MGSTSIPMDADYINFNTCSVTPSTIHAYNTGLQRYFRRYLLQKVISVFKWTLPEEWSKDYFLYCLYSWGYLAIINTDKYGVIPQGCGLSGYDVFYRPTKAIITNPLLRGILEPRIGTQCTLIKLQPDYGGVMDLVDYYSSLLALCSDTASVNMLNSKLSYVFTAGDKAAAESLKKLYDRIASGDPAVVQDKRLLNADGTPAWQSFSQNVSQNYIVSSILTDMKKIEAMFDTDVGIPNANTDKKERLISNEVEANNVETATRCEMWLEQLQESCRQANDMFGINMAVDWRIKPQTEFVEDSVETVESEVEE